MDLDGMIYHGMGCARKDEAGVYTKLAYYIDCEHGMMLVLTQPGVPLLSSNLCNKVCQVDYVHLEADL